MKLEFKGTKPLEGRVTDAGCDLYAHKYTIDSKKKLIIYYTNTFVNIPQNFVGLAFPRSSVRKTSLTMTNSVGVIDCGYNGEIQVTFRFDNLDSIYDNGDRIAQLVLMPFVKPEFVEVKDFTNYSDRGDSGHGSTGK